MSQHKHIGNRKVSKFLIVYTCYIVFGGIVYYESFSNNFKVVEISPWIRPVANVLVFENAWLRSNPNYSVGIIMEWFPTDLEAIGSNFDSHKFFKMQS